MNKDDINKLLGLTGRHEPISFKGLSDEEIDAAILRRKYNETIKNKIEDFIYNDKLFLDEVMLILSSIQFDLATIQHNQLFKNKITKPKKEKNNKKLAKAKKAQGVK